MKVMWFASLPLKKIAKELNTPEIVSGGWINGLVENFVLYHHEDCEFTYVFPNSKIEKEIRGNFNWGGVHFRIFVCRLTSH